MKRIIIKVFCCIIVFLFIPVISVYAYNSENSSETTVLDISDEEEERIKLSFALESLSEQYDGYIDNYLFSFDISENGEIAVLFDDATIIVLNSDETFQTALRFNKQMLQTRVRSAKIRWNAENLEITFGFGYAYLFTREGEVLDAWKYERETNTIQKERTVVNYGNYVYEMRNSNPLMYFFGGGDHNMLVKTNEKLEEKIVFHSESSISGVAICIIILLIIIPLGWIFCIALLLVSLGIVRIKTKQRKTGTGSVS